MREGGREEFDVHQLDLKSWCYHHHHALSLFSLHSFSLPLSSLSFFLPLSIATHSLMFQKFEILFSPQTKSQIHHKTKTSLPSPFDSSDTNDSSFGSSLPRFFSPSVLLSLGSSSLIIRFISLLFFFPLVKLKNFPSSKTDPPIPLKYLLYFDVVPWRWDDHKHNTQLTSWRESFSLSLSFWEIET